MNKTLAGIILLICVICGLLIGAKSCTKRGSGNTKSGSSNPNTFTINSPSNLSATMVSLSQINLSWQSSDFKADGFEIERSTDGVNFQPVTAVSATVTTYSDQLLITLGVYYYRVRAFNTVGDRSSWSNIAAAIFDYNWVPNSWKAVAGGESHTIALASDKTLWSWGWNQNGQLGLNDYTSIIITIPRQISTQSDWSIIEAGYYASFAIKTDNTLWGWGANDLGQLGLGNTEEDRYFPVPVDSDSDWVLIAGGGNHAIALKTNNTIWSWGYNIYGQLGIGGTLEYLGPSTDWVMTNQEYLYRLTPTQIGTDSDWINITAGFWHSLAIKTNPAGGGTLWAWGWNYQGQLGDNTTDSKATPRQVGNDLDWSVVTAGYLQTIGLKTNRTLWAWGFDGDETYFYYPIPISTDSDWINVSAGGESLSNCFSIARKTNGTIWSWGNGSYGQLGIGVDGISAYRYTPTQVGTFSDWSKVTVGGFHSLGLVADSLWSWGGNEFGQLGLGDTINRNIPCQFGSPIPPASLIAIVISSSQINLSWADNSFSETGFILERSNDGVNYSQLSTLNSNMTLYSDTGLTPGVTYYYRVRTYNTFGYSPYSPVDISSRGVPVIFDPSSLVLSMNSPSSVSLFWIDNSIDEDGFKIERKLGASGTYEQIVTTTANSIYYSDTVTPALISYYYRIRAYNALTNSDYSNIANTPEVSINLSAIGISPTRIDLFWSDNSTIEDGFTIERRTSTNELWSQIGTVNANADYYSDINSFVPDSVYHYRIRAYNALGYSAYSNETYMSASGTWSKIASGGNHTLAIKMGGTFWSWGRNDYGQLGLGYSSPFFSGINTPTQVGTGSEWSKITGGDYHSLALDANGTLWAWGSNPSGQLGLGDTINRNTPTQIGTDTNWFAISAKTSYNLALKTNLTMWVWGDGIKTPTQIGSDSDWIVVATGDNNSAALKENNTLWLWGFNNYGQLGMGDNIYRGTPAQIGTTSDWSIFTTGAHTLSLKTAGTLWAWGCNGYGQLGLGDVTNRNTPTQIGTASDWSIVNGGGLYTISRKIDGTLWAWGYNRYGQLGLGDTNNRNTPTQIVITTDWLSMTAGINHTIALKTNNTLWSWGYNLYSQLGRNYGSNLIPIPVSSNNSTDIPSSFVATAVSSSQINLSWTDNCNTETGFRIERKISVTNYSLLTTVSPDTVSYSDNAVNLGWIYYYRISAYNDIGNTSYSNEAIAMPIIFTPTNLSANVISPTQVNLVWSDNSPDELGFKIERSDNSPDSYVQIDMIGSITSYYTAITAGNVYYYRVRAYNGLGDSGYSDTIYVTQGMDWSLVASGENHTIGIKTNGTIWSWGYNQYGQLGLGNSGSPTNDKNIPTQIGTNSDWFPQGVSGTNQSIIAAGAWHTIVRKSNNTLWAWGCNGDGELGLGDFDNRTTPSQVGSDSNWAEIDAGPWHTIARKTNGTLWSWGYNNVGQLGLGNSGSPANDKNVPTQIGTNSDWSVISAGGDAIGDDGYAEHSLAIKTTPTGGGTLWSWGYNKYGQLGLGNSGSPANDKNVPTQIGTASDWSNVTAGYFHTIAYKTNGTLWVWGFNDNGQLGLGNTAARNTPTSIGTSSDWVSVTAGGKHTIARKTNGTIWSWGFNNSKPTGNEGVLGLGDTNATYWRTTPSQIGTETEWAIITGGGLHSLARKNNGTLWSWGYNNSGQLGLGDGVNRSVPTLIAE
jgi:alpha-tubulin suppressor-like RCC1 family protein